MASQKTKILLATLGPKSSLWLHSIGIESVDDIRQRGVIQVCLELKANKINCSLNMAYALQGILLGCPWNKLPTQDRQALAAEWELAMAFLGLKEKGQRRKRKKTG